MLGLWKARHAVLPGRGERLVVVLALAGVTWAGLTNDREPVRLVLPKGDRTAVPAAGTLRRALGGVVWLVWLSRSAFMVASALTIGDTEHRPRRDETPGFIR